MVSVGVPPPGGPRREPWHLVRTTGRPTGAGGPRGAVDDDDAQLRRPASVDEGHGPPMVALGSSGPADADRPRSPSDQSSPARSVSAGGALACQTANAWKAVVAAARRWRRPADVAGTRTGSSAGRRSPDHPDDDDRVVGRGPPRPRLAGSPIASDRARRAPLAGRGRCPSRSTRPVDRSTRTESAATRGLPSTAMVCGRHREPRSTTGSPGRARAGRVPDGPVDAVPRARDAQAPARRRRPRCRRPRPSGGGGPPGDPA